MEQISYYTTAVSFAVVIFAWFVFAGVFIFRKKPESAPDRKNRAEIFFRYRAAGRWISARLGGSPQPLFSPLIDRQFILNIIFQISAILLAASSVWMAISAVKELGKQWSLQARLIEDHKLITGGVYQIVRHPIYTAMLGMLFRPELFSAAGGF